MISRGKSGYYRNEDIGGKSWKNAVKLDEDLFNLIVIIKPYHFPRLFIGYIKST